MGARKRSIEASKHRSIDNRVFLATDTRMDWVWAFAVTVHLGYGILEVWISPQSKPQSTIIKTSCALLGYDGWEFLDQQRWERPQQKSDIDILLDFDPQKKTYRNFLGGTACLESILDRPVDPVTPQALSPHIKPSVERTATYVQISD